MSGRSNDRIYNRDIGGLPKPVPSRSVEHYRHRAGITDSEIPQADTSLQQRNNPQFRSSSFNRYIQNLTPSSKFKPPNMDQLQAERESRNTPAEVQERRERISILSGEKYHIADNTILRGKADSLRRCAALYKSRYTFNTPKYNFFNDIFTSMRDIKMHLDSNLNQPLPQNLESLRWLQGQSQNYLHHQSLSTYNNTDVSADREFQVRVKAVFKELGETGLPGIPQT